MQCARCQGDMFEVSKIGKKLTMRCDDCGKQESVFDTQILVTPIEVRMWKSKCGNCKKIFVGTKPYCCAKCYYAKNPKPFKEESLARYGFERDSDGKIIKKDKNIAE